MLLDKENTFSDAQAITAAGDTVSTDVIDTGAAHDIGVGNTAFLFTAVQETFAGNTSLKFVLETSSVSNFASDVVELMAGPVMPVADLVAGAKTLRGRIPHGAKRYLRMKYVNVGTATAGTVYAGITLDVPTRDQYPNRSEIL